MSAPIHVQFNPVVTLCGRDRHVCPDFPRDAQAKNINVWLDGLDARKAAT